LSRKTSAPPPARTTAGVRYVALLRAVNVGGRTIKMDRLRQLFESLAMSNVQTFIASGNVIFEAPGAPAALESAIEAQLRSSLGYEVLTFLRSQAEMAAVAGLAPFADAELDGSSVYVAFFKNPPARGAAQKIMNLRSGLDDFHVHGREVFWLRRKVKERLGQPGPPLERLLDQPATTRNITTVRKIAAKYCR
jgi:uncharacterized protein (DUF1697 family)